MLSCTVWRLPELEVVEQAQLFCAWQAPSMAMLAFTTAATAAAMLETGKYTGDARFGSLLLKSVDGFADGRLPGDLKDIREALETGEGSKKPSSSGTPTSTE